MEIIEVKSNKKLYMDLLFLADEQESMINRYLDRGIMYILEDPINEDIVNGDSEYRRKDDKIIYGRHSRPTLPLVDGLGRGEAEDVLQILHRYPAF